MTSLDLDQLRTFLAVVEHGSFSRAAAALDVGQSTVSFHIKALESVVGGRVLDRAGGRVRLTPAGRILRRYATRMLALGEEALGRVRREEAGETGHVTIAASTIPAEYLLPPVLGKFRRAHPRVGITCEVSDSRRAIAALVAQECDLALVGARVPDGRILYTPFAHDEIVLVGPAPNRFAPKLKLTADDLGRVPLILREDGSGTLQAVAKALRSRPAATAQAPVRIGSSEAAKSCARHGLGLAFVSRLAVADDVDAGRLTIVRAPGLPVARTFHAARLRRVTPTTPARALITLLIQEYR